MASDIEIRSYREADHEAVVALHERAIRAAGTPPEKLPDTSDMADIEEAYLDVGGAFLVGEHDGEIVAMAGLLPAERTMGNGKASGEGGATAELKRMRVAPDHQRRGFGRAILEALEDAARDRGFDRLVLDTADRQGSAPFYRAQGYRERWRHQWREFELIRLQKEL
ncbi:MAG: GNAT family N-acetyltransferase [Halobacteriales archaeon]